MQGYTSWKEGMKAGCLSQWMFPWMLEIMPSNLLMLSKARRAVDWKKHSEYEFDWILKREQLEEEMVIQKVRIKHREYGEMITNVISMRKGVKAHCHHYHYHHHHHHHQHHHHCRYWYYLCNSHGIETFHSLQAPSMKPWWFPREKPIPFLNREI